MLLIATERRYLDR